MLVFLDDSGDPGFKLANGSSQHFVISAVIFNDELEAQQTAVAIQILRRNLGFPDDVEFRFFKSSRDTRLNFLRAVMPFDFLIRSIVIDKNVIRSEKLKTDRPSFYSYAIKQVLKHNGGTITDAKIRLDGHGDRLFRRALDTYLRRELNSTNQTIVKNMKLVDSKGNQLIQLADMIAGAVRRSYDLSKLDHDIYKRIIARKIDDEWLFR